MPATPLTLPAQLALALANKRLERGEIQAAIDAFQYAWRVEPCVPTLHGVTMAALAAQDWTAAVKHARLLTREDPRNPESFFNLGAAYWGKGDWEKARRAFVKVVGLNRWHIGAHEQLAALSGLFGDKQAEGNHADQALNAEPREPIDHFWQSRLRLWRGDYVRGWQQYEARHGLPLVVNGWRQPRGLDEAQRWTGWHPDHKRLLAYASQGHGDAIQMARYLPMLADVCDALTVMCHGSLVRLFERQARGRWRVLALDAETPPHDAYVDLMSCPHHFGTTIDTIPAPADFGDDITVSQLWQVFRPRPRRVALCTRGGAVASLDLDRSCHSGAFRAIAGLSGVEVVDFTGRTGDWLDTAHELATCDLLVSVDSALAHLAGSLGVETWLVPPTHCEWRWPADGSCPWYPSTHRMYRRRHTRDWQAVVARIRDDLQARVACQEAA